MIKGGAEQLPLVLLLSGLFSVTGLELSSSCASEGPQGHGQASSLLQVSNRKEVAAPSERHAPSSSSSASSSSGSWLKLSTISSTKKQQQKALSNNNAGCYILNTEAGCLSSKDGRRGASYSDSPCQWCCGLACTTDNANKCEPKQWLFQQANYVGKSKNGLGEDTCEATSYTLEDGKSCGEGRVSGIQTPVTPADCKIQCDNNANCQSYEIISATGVANGFSNWCVVRTTDDCGTSPKSNADWARYVKTSQVEPFIAAQKGQARTLLPPVLFNLGIKVLQNEDTLDAVVANTNYHNVTYSGEKLYMRLVNGEGEDFATFEPDVYGLGSLATFTPNEVGMLEMMDIGGNVGVASIAAFKKAPNRLRIIAVEPVPSTFFLFAWNLWLNGVPRLSEEQFHANATQSGVVVFHSGISGKDDEAIGLCYTPPYTMAAKLCDCAAQGNAAWAVSQLPGVKQCANLFSLSFDTLLGLFPTGRAHLSFLKVDCEGCELDLFPALSRLSQNPAWKLGRLAGELHAIPNAVEDVACSFEGGKWMEHVCNTGTAYTSVRVADRCRMGASRKTCTGSSYGGEPNKLRGT